MAADRAGFVAEETPRMETVLANFRLYKVIEIALLAAGISRTKFRDHEIWYAIGTGLGVSAALTLVLDLFADKRGDLYLDQIRALSG